MRILKSAIAIVWEWLSEPFREDPLDVPIGLEDTHELAGGQLPELVALWPDGQVTEIGPHDHGFEPIRRPR